MSQRRLGRWATTTITWLIGVFFFFPVLWMVVIGLRDERDAATPTPTWFAKISWANYHDVFAQDVLPYLWHSLIAASVSTALAILLAFPAAFALSVRPVPRYRDVMSFFLSTKFLPPIAALLPIYLIVKQIHLLDNIWALAVLYTTMNMPLLVWMLRSFLAEVPREITEAAELDGCGTLRIMGRVLAPISTPGIAASALISFIFAWNEFLLAVNLTATQSGTGPVALISFITSEGLFFAHLAAVSTLVSLPVVIAGVAAQDKLVRGLSMGAVK